MVNKECIECGNRENLLISGGQFCGGTWCICKKCDEEAKRFQEFMKSDKFKQIMKGVLNGR